MLLHLPEIWLLPDREAVGHWRAEVVAFQKKAAWRFAPSMRRRIALAKQYDDAVGRLEAGVKIPVPLR